MLAKFRSAVSKLRTRQREAARRQTQRRTLRAEPLEGRLLMAGDSWVLPVEYAGGRRPVATDNDGNVYVATTEWLRKLDPAGQELWTRAFQGATAMDLAAISNDGIYMVGSCGVAVDFDLDDPNSGQITLHSEASDGFLAKFNTDTGDFAWAIPFGGELNDYLIGVTTTDNAVFVTGNFVVPDRKTTRADMLVAKVTNNGDITWTETFPLGQGESIQVFAPSGSPASVYVAGGPVVKLTETVDESTGVATGATLNWTYPSGRGTDIAVGTQTIGTTVVPSLYAMTRSVDGLSAQLLKFNEQGAIQWSRSIMTGNIGSDEGEMAAENGVVYVGGCFVGEVLFGDDVAHTTLTSRGGTDAFVARYAADGGSLQDAQRMGGSGFNDRWHDMAIGGGHIFAAGSSNSTDGDYPADNPKSAGLSAFVPRSLPDQLFVMRLDAAAPVVQANYVKDDTSVTLSATTTSPDPTIAWYDKNGVALTDPAVNTPTFTPTPAQLLPGVNQFTAVATDGAGLIGMAGVVVTLAAHTKFYVVDDNSANTTFEYDAYGSPVESYSLNSGNTAPRGAASTVAGDTTWVVDANRKVYVYDTSGNLSRSWTAGTLSTKAKVEGITVYGNDVWIVDDYSNKVYRYANGALANNVTLTAAASPIPLNSANTTPKDIVTDGNSLWVVNDSTTDMVFKYTLSGTLLGSWTINGGGGSPTGITLDPSNVSQDLWIVDNGTDKVYQYTNGRTVTSGTGQTATMIFSLAPGNTNPQGIADPPAPGSVVTTEAVVLAEPVAAEVALVGNDTVLEDLDYYEPPRNVRVDHTPRAASHTAVIDVSAPDYTVGAAPKYVVGDNRWATDDDSHSEVDDLFADWDSDPLELVSLPDLGM